MHTTEAADYKCGAENHWDGSFKENNGMVQLMTAYESWFLSRKNESVAKY